MLMKETRQSILILVLLVAILVFLPGCSGTGSSPSLPISTIDTPGDIPPDLSEIQVFFTKNQNDKTSVHITSLNRDIESTITLENEGGKVILSPSGSYLAYRFGERVNGEYHSGIWVRDLKDGVERKVIIWPEDNSVVQLNNPNFYPEEDKVIFSIIWYKTDTVGLATVNIDGSDLQIIGIPQGSLNEGPNISPDGEKILVLCAGIDVDSGQPGFMLCIMNKDGSERIQLTNNGDSHGRGLFTPDSKKIVYSESEHGGILGIINKPSYQIKVMDIDGTNEHTILDWKWPIYVQGVSEDGEEVILIEEPTDGSTDKLYVINIDGTNLRHLAYFDDFLAGWFPKE